MQNEYNGLRQVKQYVFKRQRTSTTSNVNILNPLNPDSLQGRAQPISSTSNLPITKASRSSEIPTTYDQGLEQNPGSLKTALPNASRKTPATQSLGYGVNRQPSDKSKAEPRRFHISRSSIRTDAGGIPSYVRGVKGPPAVFIERRREPETKNKVSDTAPFRELGPSSPTTPTHQYKSGDGGSQPPSTDIQSRPSAPLRNVRLPSGKVVPWDADSETLARQMEAYTMQEIGYNIAKASTAEISSLSTPVIRARQVSSFKPKAPALIYHGRHPDQTKATEAKKGTNQDEIMTDAADPDGDDSEYVVETYIRLPAEMFEFDKQNSIGLLVLDSQPDIDEFFNDESDSDSEIYDEEEDENGKPS